MPIVPVNIIVSNIRRVIANPDDTLVWTQISGLNNCNTFVVKLHFFWEQPRRKYSLSEIEQPIWARKCVVGFSTATRRSKSGGTKSEGNISVINRCQRCCLQFAHATTVAKREYMYFCKLHHDLTLPKRWRNWSFRITRMCAQSWKIY